MGNLVAKYGREINRVVVHATGGNPNSTEQEILSYWKNVKHWEHVGYNKLIFRDRVATLALPHQVVNGVKGYNWDSYHIAWVGGSVADGDNRTQYQKEMLYREVKWAIDEFQGTGTLDVIGHRDLSKDLDGNGIITPSEWSKQCPSFNMIEWMNKTGLYNYLLSK